MTATTTHKRSPWLALIIVIVICAIGYAVYTKGTNDSTAANTPCMVTATGNQVCGQAAAAWCRTTDGLRGLAPNNADVMSTQADCDSIESQYP